MSNELENQIKEEVFKDKINYFYKKNKKFFIITSFIIILVPIVLQILLYYNYKKKAYLLSEYLRAEILIEKDKTQGLEILKRLKSESNETISLLSFNRLLEYYISNDDKKNAIQILDNYNKKVNYNIGSDLKMIKKVILNFDYIQEPEILQLLDHKNKSSNFNLIKKKLLIDFYTKNNQLNKANQIKKN